MASKQAIADMMTRIRNANLAGRQKTTAPATKTTHRIAQILKDEGSIYDFKEVSSGTSKYLVIEIKDGSKSPQSIINSSRHRYKAGLRVYTNAMKLPSILGESGAAIKIGLQDEKPSVRIQAVQELGKIISSKGT